jgi:hypothetical protein
MFHIWNIRSSSAAAAATAIEDFYIHENMSSTNPKQNPHTQINKSFPRHHALVCASLDSTRELIARRDTGGVCRKRYTTTNDDARTTAYQKHHLVSMSGLAGLLIARWTGVTGARAHTIKTAKKHAEITAKYTHSTLACEILVGNRYYRDLPRVLASLSSLSSSSSNIIGNDISMNLTSADVTPESVAATKTELLETYTAQIDRLLDAVVQYKRGFVGLHTIRSDPEFMRMMCAYWRYCKQLIKIHRNFEENRDDDDYDGDSDGECFVAAADETFATRRFFVSADVSAVSAMVPQLYNYDIVHLFDGATQGYAKFVKITRHTLVRLSNDGLTTAFLSFAAIEPRMVTAEMAPKHGTKYLTTSLPSCANHIPSRDPLFGALRVLHRANIPRTADAVNAVNADIQGIPRLPPSIRNVRNYSPLYDTLENIRAGRRQGTTPMITSAARAYMERRAAAWATEAAAEAADGWVVVCSRRKRK